MQLTGRDKSTAPGTAVSEAGALGVLCPHKKPGLTDYWGSQHRQIEPIRAHSESHCLALMQVRCHKGKTVHASLSNMAINQVTIFEDRFIITRNANKASVSSKQRLQRKISNSVLNNLHMHRNFAESTEELLDRQVILCKTEFLSRLIRGKNVPAG